MCMYSLLYSACGVIQLGFLLCNPDNYVPTNIFMHTPMKLYTDISTLLRILMACEKAGTASFLDYPVTLFFITRYSITASFVKTVISFAVTDTRIACIYMASRGVAFVSESTISHWH